MPQPHTFLPDFTATCFVAVPSAFECHTLLVLLDPGELVFTDTFGASSRNQCRGRATKRAGSRRSDLGRDRRPRCDSYEYGRMTANTHVRARIPVRGFATRRALQPGGDRRPRGGFSHV